MSTYAFNEMLNDVVHRLQGLPLDEQEQFLDELTKIIHQRAVQRPKKHNVMEFQGAAGDYWKNIDVKKFIEEERNSWDG